MKKRIAAILLILTLVVCALGGPAGLAEARYTASTSLEEASRNNIKNIKRAAEAINGFQLDYGERFSFNEVVGPRTKAQGYVAAENARGVSVTGGGVSQVATTLYLALLRLGDAIEYTELTTYGSRFMESYVSDGNMAVLTDYSGGTDFEFVNRAGDMTIEMWASDSALNCVITVDAFDDDADFGDGEGDEEDDDEIMDWFREAWNNSPMAATAAPVRTVSASIPWSGDKGTLTNVRLAAEAIDGVRLDSRDVFSFNEIVGPRSKKYGYVSGINGRGVRVTGGGVAQVASAVWLAVKKMDDISVIEKSTYGERYNQDYVASSADAILTDYKSDKDFSFRYKGGGTIVIHTAVAGDYINCDITYE